MTRTNPVLLVHGFASSFDLNWREPGWADLLADAGREVIAVDLLGHGDAPKPHQPEAYADLGARVREALPSGVEVDAVGFSLGASVLLRLAGDAPARFGRLVVGGVGANLLRSENSDAIAEAVEHGAAEEDPVGQLFARFAAVPGNDRVALAACLRGSRRRFTPEELRRVTRPVLVALGERDFAGPPGPLVDALPDASLVMLPGVDHFATPTDFRFMDAALGFLEAVPS